MQKAIATHHDTFL